MPTLITLSLLSLALAQPRDAGRVQSGEDIQAWRALQATSPDDPAALKGFVEEFPSSPLAELAYSQLIALDGDRPELSPVAMARLDSSLGHHQDSLTRRPTQVAVATLSLAPSTASLAPASASFDLSPRLELGAVGELDVAALYLGGGMHGTLSGLGARGVLGNGVREAALVTQLHPFPELRLEPYAELSAGWVRKWDSASLRHGPLLATALGTYAPLTSGLSLTAAAELRWSEAGASLTSPLSPRLRVGLTWSF
ncbi:MAG: hypothetical protein H6740_28800 [Alphaproteobacteria bacterium]|nr:hypothetical protein [Alphaproteobacteria bacterium]